MISGLQIDCINNMEKIIKSDNSQRMFSVILKIERFFRGIHDGRRCSLSCKSRFLYFSNIFLPFGLSVLFVFLGYKIVSFKVFDLKIPSA